MLANIVEKWCLRGWYKNQKIPDLCGGAEQLLKILDPITVATVISCSPFRALTTTAASSGRLVPKATSVKPIISSLTPIAKAIPLAPQTRS
ncbi:hypothetical protein MJO57_24410 [Endozoicomonas sp. SCSIO W0465]|nr:hypothetical protein [Endozoicomonas sp. SCSIO W0465]USE35216.1 hypothetical protein MJO57_24410 [Endozoicomonas sp. SCSIO W0465]